MKVLEADPKILVHAAGQAQRAANMIQGIEPEKLPSMEERQKNRQYAETLAKEVAEARRIPYQPSGFEIDR